MALAAMNLVHFDRFVGVCICNRYASEGTPITLPKIIIMNMPAASNGDFLMMASPIRDHVLPSIQLD